MITLEAHGYRLTLDPARGARLDRLDWHHHARGWQPLLVQRQPNGPAQAGCFIMAPFANRIASGTFRFGGIDHAIPVNLPQENMAIHGHARDKSWQVLDADRSQARLDLGPCRHGPWRFAMELQIALSPQGVTLDLGLTNRGAATMPFGMGFHPWFAKTKGATLAFTAPRALRRDAQGLPLDRTDPCPAFDPAAPHDLAKIAWCDALFPDWSDRHARITTPAAEITLQAGGALRHLHVYVPDTLPVFCAEPVSHAPDAINRPAVPQMDLLAPDHSLRGRMTLSAAPALDRAFASLQEVSDDPQDL